MNTGDRMVSRREKNMAQNRRTSGRNYDRRSRRRTYYTDEFNYMDGNAALQPQQEEEPERVLRPVPRRRKRKVRKIYRKTTAYGLRYFVFLCFSIALTAIGSVYYVKTSAEVTSKASEVAGIRTELMNLQTQNRSMEENLSVTLDLNDVYNYAVNELGMSYPDKDQIIYYDSSNDSYIHQFESIPDNK